MQIPILSRNADRRERRRAFPKDRMGTAHGAGRVAGKAPAADEQEGSCVDLGLFLSAEASSRIETDLIEQ